MTASVQPRRGRVVQGAGSYTSQQGSIYAPGISAETVGAQAVFLGRVTIPANVPHVAVNRGAVPAVFIGVRNEPTAQESVVMLPELDALVP